MGRSASWALEACVAALIDIDFRLLLLGLATLGEREDTAGRVEAASRHANTQ